MNIPFDDVLRKQIDRIQQETKLVQDATNVGPIPRDSLSDALEAIKPSGTLAIDAMMKKSLPTFEATHRDSIQQTIAEASRALQTGAGLLQDFVRGVNNFQLQLAQAFQPFVQVVQAAEQIPQAIRVALEPVQRIREAFGALSPDQFSAFQQAFIGLADRFRLESDVVEKPAFRLFTKLGLTGLESHLTLTELRHVLKLTARDKSLSKNPSAALTFG